MWCTIIFTFVVMFTGPLLFFFNLTVTDALQLWLLTDCSGLGSLDLCGEHWRRLFPHSPHWPLSKPLAGPRLGPIRVPSMWPGLGVVYYSLRPRSSLSSEDSSWHGGGLEGVVDWSSAAKRNLISWVHWSVTLGFQAQTFLQSVWVYFFLM